MIKIIASVPKSMDTLQLAQQLVEQARAEGVDLVGPDGLLSGQTKAVLETALEAEISEHLGYDKHNNAGAPRRRETPALRWRPPLRTWLEQLPKLGRCTGIDLYVADRGLGLVVYGRHVPHLRFEVAAGRRMLLRQ
jgi:hypothetical protein